MWSKGGDRSQGSPSGASLEGYLEEAGLQARMPGGLKLWEWGPGSEERDTASPGHHPPRPLRGTLAPPSPPLH